ncbi:TonB-dependent receptor [Sphingomonas abietis]|uniref:TonB-dependent receptor n=1 Tax=Sphingomonas abietis TaxID=3012344 RepID=A0ABY7NJE0_9SPHN|nr:TonB-dependent receptor [Sphingomonas abietis]WBO21362.1 TonB-dependent receptor [Sphingomonas abietis]
MGLVGLTMLIGGTPVLAEDVATAPDKSGGEIVVTAERRTTPLQTTPLSVGVLSGKDIQEQKLVQLRDLSSSVAGLQVPAAATPSLSYLFIRGIGTISPTYSGAVGIYVDDVYQARVINSGIFGLPDIERIEVLRGPQGTLYGQNTSAGAIKIVSKTPGNDFTGSFSLAAGNLKQLDGSAYVSGPIVTDVLSASFAYAHDETGGFTENVTLGKKVNRVHTDQGRVKLHFTPAGDAGPDVNASFYFLRDRSDNAALSPLNVADPNPRVTYENLDLRIHNNNYLGSLSVAQKLDDHLTAKSITGYRWFDDSPDPWSQDGLATDTFEWQLNLHQRQFSQELQLLGDYGRLTFSSGAIYYHEHFIADRPNVTFGVRGGAISKTVTDSVGIYTQGHYAITPRFGVTAGLRYYRQWDDYDNSGYTSNADFQPIATTYSLTGLKQTTHGLTPKVGIDYKFSSSLFAYASYTKGQKSGGYNPVAAAAVIAAIAIKPEKVTTYEAGLKIGSGRAPVQFNISGFYNDFRDYQTNLSNVLLNGILVNGSVAFNAQKSRTYGVEVETILHPVKALELRVNGTALSAKFTRFTYQTAFGSGSYTGNQLPYASKYNLGASAAYTLPIGELGDVKLRGEVKYTSRGYADLTNVTVLPKQTYVNLDANFTTANKHWQIFVRARNLLDKTYAIGGIPITPTIPGVLATTYNPPRTVEGGATYSF